MKGNWEVLGEAGLQFFGKMSASISHEIKNALAIINESAGLLEDLSLRAEKGIPVEPERLKKQTSSILKQVRRTDGIIQNMNKFAHSIDEPLKTLDVTQTVTLMNNLSSRFAAMRGVVVAYQVPSTPMMIRTNPFFLENLLWLCLDFAMNAAGTGKTINLLLEKAEGGVRVRFVPLERISATNGRELSEERMKALLAALQAELNIDEGKHELSLSIGTAPIED
jgi:C4-dicarboxylate-specific signal transduction histidine kinase